MGVKTKNGKHATITFLKIPDLIEVVRLWDVEVRGNLTDDNLWFAPLDPDTLQFSNVEEIGKHRPARARKDLKAWVNKLGLPYFSPHKFRHGHTHYAISRATTIADLKAISLNLMHSDIKVTDGVYSVLSEEEIFERVGNLEEDVNTRENNVEIILLLEELLKVLKK